MEEAVAQGGGRGKDALDHMKPTPLPLERTQSAVDVSASVINDTKSLTNTWSPLLQKVQLLSELVDTIAEVRYQTP
jgi:hypothetical protein